MNCKIQSAVELIIYYHVLLMASYCSTTFECPGRLHWHRNQKPGGRYYCRLNLIWVSAPGSTGWVLVCLPPRMCHLSEEIEKMPSPLHLQPGGSTTRNGWIKWSWQIARWVLMQYQLYDIPNGKCPARFPAGLNLSHCHFQLFLLTLALPAAHTLQSIWIATLH